jgi:RING finger/CHY zinc finger protein 1
MRARAQLACPICMKSYADLAPIWRRVDEEVAATPMPPDYAHWVAHILCNDCNQARSRCTACRPVNSSLPAFSCE